MNKLKQLEAAQGGSKGMIKQIEELQAAVAAAEASTGVFVAAVLGDLGVLFDHQPTNLT